MDPGSGSGLPWLESPAWLAAHAEAEVLAEMPDAFLPHVSVEANLRSTDTAAKKSSRVSTAESPPSPFTVRVPADPLAALERPRLEAFGMRSGFYTLTLA